MRAQIFGCSIQVRLIQKTLVSTIQKMSAEYDYSLGIFLRHSCVSITSS